MKPPGFRSQGLINGVFTPQGEQPNIVTYDIDFGCSKYWHWGFSTADVALFMRPIPLCMMNQWVMYGFELEEMPVVYLYAILDSSKLFIKSLSDSFSVVAPPPSL